MLQGQREAQWNHTAALITHLRLCHGDKRASFDKLHPFRGKQSGDANKQFKEYVSKVKENK